MLRKGKRTVATESAQQPSPGAATRMSRWPSVAQDRKAHARARVLQKNPWTNRLLRDASDHYCTRDVFYIKDLRTCCLRNGTVPGVPTRDGTAHRRQRRLRWASWTRCDRNKGPTTIYG